MKKIACFTSLLFAVLLLTPARLHAAEEKTIVAVASDAGQFKTLVAAIKAAGLVKTLNGKGPFTSSHLPTKLLPSCRKARSRTC